MIRGLTRTLAMLEALLAVAALCLGVWVGFKAMERLKTVQSIKVVFPGPQADELVANQETITKTAFVAEVLWVSCAFLGFVAAFELWRFRRVGLVASLLLSLIYAVDLGNRIRTTKPWEPMAAVVVVRLALAGALIRWGAYASREPTLHLAP